MNDKSLYSDFLGKFIRISMLFLGFSYVCGLFISHFHLRRLGIHEFSPFQIQYILTGFTFVLILVAPILVLIVILTIAGKKAPIISKILELSLVIILAGIAMIYMILFFFYGDFEWSWIFTRFGKIIKFGGIYWLLYGWLVYATGKSLIDDLVRIRLGEILPSRELWVPAAFLFTMFILFSTYYANTVHPIIDSSLGGGKPISADFLISSEGSTLVNSLGLTLDDNRFLRKISVVHESPSMIYIIPQKKEKAAGVRSIALPRKIVEGIRILSEK